VVRNQRFGWPFFMTSTLSIKNADRLGVSVADYSLWGGSAGARMVGNIALHGTAGFGGDELPKPRIVIIAYTGHTIFSEHFPPTFINDVSMVHGECR
jgi:hypothetical protein